ncbi:MAG: 30S ribosomal protein S2 [bacterium]|nr:30S ribosomal protein S2 [bacterium]
MDIELQKENELIDQMFKVGAHYGFGKSRRHPSASSFIFGIKNRVEIFDLEKTSILLERAKIFAKELGKGGKTLLFVGSKHEAQDAIEKAAKRLSMPFVFNRWIGGTLTNFSVIRGRVEKLHKLLSEKEKGEHSKYTKKERILIDREVERLEKLFGGISNMAAKPHALFVVDPKHESTAIAEAKKTGIPVISLLGSDCDKGSIEYPIFGNDSSKSSISFFAEQVAESYESGKTATTNNS